MLGAWACAVLICAASLVLGRALLVALGRREWTWLAAPVGLASLVVLAQPLVRLPGDGVTAAAVIALVVVAALVYLWRRPRGEDGSTAALAREALPPTLIVLALSSLPFLLAGRLGVLGEGVYTNDHAAQLFWSEWLATGFGPEPRGIAFGYPLGPQSLVAAVARGTGASVETAFDGLLLAIPVLTALAALTPLRELTPLRRTAAASLVGLPYLAASFLAQSAFKETAMALFVVGIAIALSDLRRPGTLATLASLGVLSVASVLTFSLAGLVWPIGAAALWLVAELVGGRIALSPRRVTAALRPLWPVVLVGLAALAVLIAAQAGTLSNFVDRFGDIQSSTGRLFSSISPREVLGVWPEGDFRTDASGGGVAVLATLLGLAAAAFATWWWWARRPNPAIPATVAAAVIVYALARALAGIHVEAKALAVMAPVLMLFVLVALLAPSRAIGAARIARTGLALAFVVAAAGSTVLALRAAPVGAVTRGGELESLRDRVEGKPVLVLVADRFSSYRLRGALAGSPGGYVPGREVAGRPGKLWDQGVALDFDSVTHRVLNGYRYVITANVPYTSSPPPEFERVASTPSYVLWRRQRQVPAREVVEGPNQPGRTLDCGQSAKSGTATVLPPPVHQRPGDWQPERSFSTGGSAEQAVRLTPGRWQLSLQYHSAVPVLLQASGLDVELPASLEGMYGFEPGEGQFWPAGSITVRRPQAVRVTVRQGDRTWIERLLGVERRTWLGTLALSPGTHATEVALDDACGRYVDRYRFDRGAQR
jgi:hypothetical protein